MKNVLILGAAGLSATAIIPRLLQQADVKLTLFARPGKKLPVQENERIRIIKGDALKESDMKQAVAGQDIVISTLGGMDLAEKTENIVRAMRQAGVPRLVVMSAGGIYDELPEPFNSWDKSVVGHTRPTNLRTAEIAEQSGLQYTVLRPVWLNNREVEDFVLTQKGETYIGKETSRASIGRIVAEIVTNPALHANQNLGISQAH